METDDAAKLDTGPLLDRARSAQADAEHAEVVTITERVLAEEPGNLDALRLKIGSPIQLGRLDDAEMSLVEALKIRPDDPTFSFQHAVILRQHNRYDEVVEALDRGLATDPDNLLALQGKTAALRMADRLDEAEGTARRALTTYPDDVVILNELGMVEYNRSRYADAVNSFDRSLATDPDNRFALEWKVTALRLSDRLDEAEDDTPNTWSITSVVGRADSPIRPR